MAAYARIEVSKQHWKGFPTSFEISAFAKVYRRAGFNPRLVDADNTLIPYGYRYTFYVHIFDLLTTVLCLF
jgi:hypothetical protein